LTTRGYPARRRHPAAAAPGGREGLPARCP
jgi:hypothetical protein